MKVRVTLPEYTSEPAYGLCEKLQTGKIEYYATVFIHSVATDKLLESYRFFKAGEYGSPSPFPAGMLAFYHTEFPDAETDWLKAKMQEWCDAAGAQYDSDDTKAELYNIMLIWADAHHYPVSEVVE